jgi:hypothetical protein
MSAHYLADMPRNQRVAGATTPPTSIGHALTEIALRHLLEARWQFVQAVNVQTDAAAFSNGYVADGYSYVADKVADKQYQKNRQPCRQCAEPSDEQPKYHQSSHQFATRQRSDVMAYWHVSNSYLEHTLLHLAQHVLEPQTIDLNVLIEGIVACIVKPLPAQRPNPTQHNTPQHNTPQYNTPQHNHNPVQQGRYPVNANGSVGNGSIRNGTIGMEVLGVDVGIATTLPTVSAPLLLLHWVFSELLITSWLNSLPASVSASEPHNVLQIPLTDMATTDVATVVVNCLDADDAWHITISSDHHHADLATAALTQLQAALQQIGGDMHMMCDDDALLQTVILPKVPRG